MKQYNDDLGNTYLEGQLINRGGFCNIYECSHFDKAGNLSNQNLVLKRLIREDGLGTEPHRFTREIRYFDELNHAHILKPYYCDEYEGIIVMERFPMNLSEFIDDNSYDLSTCFRIFNQIIDAVEYYTAKGYLHRDLKPQNILVSSESNIKITDFGLSARQNRDETFYALTKTDTNGGTDNYSAPEQLIDLNKADIRSEIYSLGKIFYALYSKDNFKQEMTHLSKLPSDVRFFIQKATKFNPNERFNNLVEFKEAYLLLNDNPNSIDIIHLELDEALKTISGLLKSNDEFLKTSKIFNITNNPSFEQTAFLFIDLPIKEHEAIKKLDSSLYNDFISLSCDSIEKRGFDFAYVDVISEKIIALLDFFEEEIDIEIQAQLINAVITVACDHNRFSAMKNVGQHISTLRNRILISELKKVINIKDIQKIRNYHDSSNAKLLIS